VFIMYYHITSQWQKHLENFCWFKYRLIDNIHAILSNKIMLTITSFHSRSFNNDIAFGAFIYVRGRVYNKYNNSLLCVFTNYS
jgi:hypothetical protein